MNSLSLKWILQPLLCITQQNFVFVTFLPLQLSCQKPATQCTKFSTELWARDPHVEFSNRCHLWPGHHWILDFTMLDYHTLSTQRIVTRRVFDFTKLISCCTFPSPLSNWVTTFDKGWKVFDGYKVCIPLHPTCCNHPETVGATLDRLEKL